MSRFEQFFSSNKLMIVSLVITLAAFAVSIVLSGISIAYDMKGAYFFVFDVIMFLIAITLYRSFAKHETNAMNIVTGAAIGILLINHVNTCVLSVTSYGMQIPSVVSLVAAVLYAILLVNHIQINSIHTGTRGRIILNQIILTVIAAYSLFVIVLCIVQTVYAPEMMREWIYLIAFCFAKVFLSIMIICIETKLNAYKLDREAAKTEGDWTDEKKAETKEKYFGK